MLRLLYTSLTLLCSLYSGRQTIDRVPTGWHRFAQLRWQMHHVIGAEWADIERNAEAEQRLRPD
jgi:hypothetical protein